MIYYYSLIHTTAGSPPPVPGMRNIRIHKFDIFNYIYGSRGILSLVICMCKFTHVYSELKQRGISEYYFKKKKVFLYHDNSA